MLNGVSLDQYIEITGVTAGQKKSVFIIRTVSFFLLLPLFAISLPASGVVTGDIVASDDLLNSLVSVGFPYSGNITMDPYGNITATWIGTAIGGTDTLVGVRRYPLLEGGGPGVYITQSPVIPGSPQVKADAQNRIVVAWAGTDTDGTNVYFRCYDADIKTTSRIEQTRANDIVQGDQNYPAIVMNADGSFTLLWKHAPITNDPYTEIHARDYNANCTPLSGSYVVYSVLLGASIDRKIVASGDSAGDAVVSWREGDGQGAWQIKAQRLGSPQVSAFQVASGATITPETNVSVAARPTRDGEFVVSWVAQEATTNGLYVRRYKADGTALDSAPKLLFSDPDLRQIDTAMDALGHFGLAMTVESATLSNRAYIQQFDATMTPLYDPKQIRNSDYSFNSLALASDADGDLVFAWIESTDLGFHAITFAGPEPVDVAVAVENNPDRTIMDRLELMVTVTNNETQISGDGIENGIGTSTGIKVKVTHPLNSVKQPMLFGDWDCDRSSLCTLKKPLPPGATHQFNIDYIDAPLGIATSGVSLTSQDVDQQLANNIASVETKLCNDYGGIGFSVDDPNIHISEGIGSYTATIHRIGGVCGRVSARVSTHQVTVGLAAVPGTDYTRIETLLEWADGDSADKMVSVPILDNNLVDKTKQFELRIWGLNLAHRSGEWLLLVNIQDDDKTSAPTALGSSDSGGGGSMDLPLLFVCLLMVMVRLTAWADVGKGNQVSVQGEENFLNISCPTIPFTRSKLGISKGYNVEIQLGAKKTTFV